LESATGIGVSALVEVVRVEACVLLVTVAALADATVPATLRSAAAAAVARRRIARD
jgi:hypothetical protein